MYLLNERLRKFFTPIAIIALMSEILFLIIENNSLYNFVSSYTVDLLGFCSSMIIFLIYVVYPLVKILFKKYGTLVQRIIVMLILISLVISFSSIEINLFLLLIVFLAIFLNFSLNIKKSEDRYYILIYSTKKINLDFGKIVNSSLFNVLMSVVLLTIVFVESLYYFDLYFILNTVLVIIFVLSSVFYGKSDKLIDY